MLPLKSSQEYPDHELADDARNALEEMDAQAKARSLVATASKLTKKERAISPSSMPRRKKARGPEKETSGRF